MLILNSERKQHRIKYEEGEVSITFVCQGLLPSEVDELIKKSTVTSWDSPSKKEQKQRFKESDPFTFTMLKLDKCIISWEGIVDKDKTPVECNKLNKLRLFESNMAIVNEVFKRLDELEQADKLAEKEQEKNLESSSNGTGNQEQ